MAGLLYELTLAAFGVRANGWFCGVSRGRMWAVSGDDFGDRVRGWLLSGTRWAGSGHAVRRGKWKKGSSDAEGAIGWTKNRKHGRMSDEIRAWGWGVQAPLCFGCVAGLRLVGALSCGQWPKNGGERRQGGGFR